MLFIGTRFSNLYTSVDTPARGRVVDINYEANFPLGWLLNGGFKKWWGFEFARGGWVSLGGRRNGRVVGGV